MVRRENMKPIFFELTIKVWLSDRNDDSPTMEATQNVWHGNVHTSTDTLVPIEPAGSSDPVDIALARGGARNRFDSETLEHVSIVRLLLVL